MINYTVALYYKPNTERGKKGHEDCPYELKLAEGRAEAEEMLVKLAYQDYTINKEKNCLYRNGILIYEGGDTEVDMESYYIRIYSWKEFKKKANLNPSLVHAKMGATTEENIMLLLD